MKAAWPWLAPAALLPVVPLGLWLWRDQGAFIWISNFFAACF
jgi:hypothetical protein